MCKGSSEKHSGNLFTDYVPTVIQATRLLYGLNQETWENLLSSNHSKLETSRKKKLGWSHTKQANELQQVVGQCHSSEEVLETTQSEGHRLFK